MKKLFIATFVVFGLTFGAQAQEVTFGAKTGANFSNITGDATDNYKMKVGFHVGGVVLYMINKKMGLQGEVLYSTQGAKRKTNITIADSQLNALTITREATFKRDYINVPISFKYFIVKGFNVAAGPQVGFLVTAKDDIEFNSEAPSEFVSESRDVKEFTNSVDFGMHIGTGYTLDNGLNFDARYIFGLTNINDFEGSSNLNQKNSVFQLSVAYMF